MREESKKSERRMQGERVREECERDARHKEKSNGEGR